MVSAKLVNNDNMRLIEVYFFGKSCLHGIDIIFKISKENSCIGAIQKLGNQIPNSDYLISE